MTPERRIARAERVLKMLARSGRKYRKEFREQINILIHTQLRDNEEWRVRHRAMDEKITILINAQIATDEQIKKTDEQIKKTDKQIEALTASQAKTEEALDRLAASQAKTDKALERFINGLSKGRNGNSSE